MRIHVWKGEPSLEGVKAICGEIKRAIGLGRLVLPLRRRATTAPTADALMRTLLYPDGEHSHGMLTEEALVTGRPELRCTRIPE
ncbi:DUF3168 domain-containing protein [Paracoccus sp. S-4012]|uniref:DUF3168 domain-containing protein n=1 Tax=Paracoccus sp. S-4012 TaxID=2665648 RepID=UPI0012AF1E78|nr:DUF3168 domain-containing protein [Paracoccus sp. S-4012]